MENKKYSILIIALDCYTGHILSFINHLKAKNPLVDITLLTDKETNEIKDELYDKSINIVLYDVQNPSRIKNKWIRALVLRYRQNKYFLTFSKNRKFDIIDIHWAKRFLVHVYSYLRMMSDNLVLTPWGSDILRQKTDALKQLKKLYNKANYITTDLKTPLGKKIIEEFNVNPNIIVGNFFGSDIVDFAIKYGDTITQDNAKQRFDLSDKFVITCGYNGNKNQRHKEIITAIAKIKDLLPENLTLLFPMTYGRPKKTDYLGECKKECDKNGLHSIFITDFLSVEDVYKLRKATDIFVHIQTTDASSGSLQEYILCNKKIVHGSWIKYEEMEKYKPIFYFPVDKLDNLGEVIVKAYNSDNIKIPQGVIDYVKNSGWDNKATLMNEFFMSII